MKKMEIRIICLQDSGDACVEWYGPGMVLESEMPQEWNDKIINMHTEGFLQCGMQDRNSLLTDGGKEKQVERSTRGEDGGDGDDYGGRDHGEGVKSYDSVVMREEMASMIAVEALKQLRWYG